MIRPLAAFGERAVPSVLAVESSTESGTGAVNHALITLRFIVEEAGARGGRLSQDTLAELRRVAARLQDHDLRQSVEALAADAGMVMARGIADPELIEQTQRRAADRVAGLPPLPRP